MRKITENECMSEKEKIKDWEESEEKRKIKEHKRTKVEIWKGKKMKNTYILKKKKK